MPARVSKLERRGWPAEGVLTKVGRCALSTRLPPSNPPLELPRPPASAPHPDGCLIWMGTPLLPPTLALLLPALLELLVVVTVPLLVLTPLPAKPWPWNLRGLGPPPPLLAKMLPVMAVVLGQPPALTEEVEETMSTGSPPSWTRGGKDGTRASPGSPGGGGKVCCRARLLMLPMGVGGGGSEVMNMSILEPTAEETAGRFALSPPLLLMPRVLG